MEVKINHLSTDDIHRMKAELAEEIRMMLERYLKYCYNKKLNELSVLNYIIMAYTDAIRRHKRNGIELTHGLQNFLQFLQGCKDCKDICVLLQTHTNPEFYIHAYDSLMDIFYEMDSTLTETEELAKQYAYYFNHHKDKYAFYKNDPISV
jgi:hypothetical protein